MPDSQFRRHASPTIARILIALSFALTPILRASENVSSAYQFSGGTMNVIYGDEKLPISGMGNGFVHFMDGQKSRRTKSNAVCSLAFQPSVAAAFVGVDDLKIQYSSFHQMRKGGRLRHRLLGSTQWH